MKIYILQGKISTLTCIAEIYMVENNFTVFDFFYRISLILHLRNFIKYFCDTVLRTPQADPAPPAAG